MMRWLYRRVRVASEGWVFVLPLAGATVLSALVGWWGVAGVGLVLTVGVALAQGATRGIVHDEKGGGRPRPQSRGRG